MVNDAGSDGMDAIAARVAHDLNNLLALMEMSAYFIGRATADHQQVQDDVGDLRQAIARAKALTARLVPCPATDGADGTDGTEAPRRIAQGTDVRAAIGAAPCTPAAGGR